MSLFHLKGVLLNVLLIVLPLTITQAFTIGRIHSTRTHARMIPHKDTVLKEASTSVDLTIDMPPSSSGLQANMKIQPILSVPSKIIQVRYKVPFGLDVAPKNQLCVCTKDGSGGEKAGDVLRYTSQWTLGLPSGDGLISTAASFSGGVSWQCSMFNVMKAASWEQVVEALTSNVDVSIVVVILANPNVLRWAMWIP